MSELFERILRHFPSYTHSLILVSDPDRLLRDEAIMARLVAVGFRMIDEPDPVQLRYQVERARPFTMDRPLIIVTGEQVRDLPYDLWQQGHHVTLSLNSFYPDLVYPVVRAMLPSQRWRLYRAPSPRGALGRQGTIDYILRHVFAVDLDGVRQPSRLVAWLNEYHQQASPMPAIFVERLLALLKPIHAYSEWPLEDLVADPEAFASFVREQWRSYVQRQTGQLIQEEPARYVVDFAADRELQDALPRLVRSRALEPVAVDQPDRLPPWARPALLGPAEDRRPRRVGELLAVLREQLQQAPTEARWLGWQAIARAWAELNALRDSSSHLLDVTQEAEYYALREALDAAFLDWLHSRYAPLGGQRLPIPHHVHHVPHFIAFQRRQARGDGVALVVLDGLALADWQLIGSTWRARHPSWRFDEQLLLAQVPTITAVSRQALVSGRRPADFASTLDHNRAERQQWASFWSAEGLPAQVCAYVPVRLDQSDSPPELQDDRVRALCLVNVDLDDTVHGATLGAADVQASLRLWLDAKSLRLEAIIDGLLSRGFAVYLASDHGHVEARGMGVLSEGLVVQTRSQRARLYRDRRAAENAQQAFGQTSSGDRTGYFPTTYGW